MTTDSVAVEENNEPPTTLPPKEKPLSFQRLISDFERFWQNPRVGVKFDMHDRQYQVGFNTGIIALNKPVSRRKQEKLGLRTRADRRTNPNT